MTLSAELYKKKDLFLWVGVFTLLASFLYAVSGILLPFIAGLIVAYLLNPVTTYLHTHKIPRLMATLLLILCFFFTIGFILFLAIPFLKKELMVLATHLPQYGERLYHSLWPKIQNIADLFGIKNAATFKETASSYIGEMISWAIKIVVGLFTNSLALANLLSLVFLTPVVAFYLLRDWPKMVQQIDRLLPREQAPVIRQQASLVNKTLSGYIRGQAMVCIILACFYSIGFSLIGLNFAFTIGIATGCLAFIPYFGFLIGATAALSVGLAQFSDWTMVSTVMLVLFIGQMLEGNVLTPNLVGDRIGLHPVWIIFSLLSGGVLFGFFGLICAIPVAATIGVFIRFVIKSYLKSNFYKPLLGS